MRFLVLRLLGYLLGKFTDAAVAAAEKVFWVVDQDLDFSKAAFRVADGRNAIDFALTFLA